MSLEYRAMLRAAAELDARMRLAGWARGKVCIRGPHGESLPADTPDEAMAAAFQAASVAVEVASKAA